MGNEQEVHFLNALEELIEAFSNNQVPTTKQTGDKKNPLRTLMNLMSAEVGATSSEDVFLYPNSHKLDIKFNVFMQHIQTTSFHLNIIPYDKITECVFVNTPPEILNSFTDELRSRGEQHFNTLEDVNEEYERQFLKIMRHIDLALIQKNSIILIQNEEITMLKQNYSDLNNRYNSLKEDADKQYKNMLTQFISILGIFAAILMGAFGAIQGFTSLFANANNLSIGKILIISSIGASSVILILFFLLNAIAKLTEKTLSSTNKKDGTWYEKHPSLVITHGVLVFVVLIGSALELSNVHLQIAWQGLWWLLPFIWISYFIIAVIKRNPFFVFQYISLPFIKLKKFFKKQTKNNQQS